MDIYGPLFRSLLFPTWEECVRRRPVARRWQELRRSQWRSLDELHASQSAALARLIDHAYRHVPFYRARFDAAGIAAADIRTPEDLWKLPLVRRAELKSISRRDWTSSVPPLPTICKETSGTSGGPLFFGYEPDSENWRRAVKLRGYEWAGYRPGDRALHFWGTPETPPPLRTRAKIALDQMLQRSSFMTCEVMSEKRLREVVRAIERLRPRVLVCYAQAGEELARYIKRNHLRTWAPIRVVVGAERLRPRGRAALEEAFGPVFETYGCREVMLIATECEQHCGLHVSMENLVVEIVVNDNGRERLAREGESGEVVLTDLHNFAMPFIRYANGDIATAGPSRPCACGRTLPRMQSVEGRVTEMLRDANGAAVNGLSISFVVDDVSDVAGVADAIRQFQAVQHRDRSVTIKLVLGDELPPWGLEEIRRNTARLLSGVDVRVQVVPELPRNAAGKHRLVVVEHDDQGDDGGSVQRVRPPPRAGRYSNPSALRREAPACAPASVSSSLASARRRRPN